MGGELVRKGSSDHALVPVTAARKAMNDALVHLRGGATIELRPQETRIIPPSRTAGEIVDLPRVCAVHDRPYVARYIRNSGKKFELAQTFRIEEWQCDQYVAGKHEMRGVPASDCQEESCPWCGAHGFGAVHCEACDGQVCHGRTNRATRYFRCRDSCGSSGTLTPDKRTMCGLAPGFGDDQGKSGR